MGVGTAAQVGIGSLGGLGTLGVQLAKKMGAKVHGCPLLGSV